MPHARRPPPARSWSVHSVFVRTRDGPDRLDLAYRRLLNAAPAGHVQMLPPAFATAAGAPIP